MRSSIIAMSEQQNILSPSLPQLYHTNPSDWFRLLWWMLVKPNQLYAHQETYGREAHYPTAYWLSSTLLILPALIPISASLLVNHGIIKDQEYILAELAIFFIIFIVLAWIIITFIMELGESYWRVWLGSFGIGIAIGIGINSVVGGIIITGIITLNFVVTGGLITGGSSRLVGFGFIAGIFVSFINSIFSNSQIMTIESRRDTFSSMLGGFSEAGPAGFIYLIILLVCISALLMFLTEKFADSHPNWLTKTAFALIPLSYIFLIWMYYLGGWQHFA